jgi:hypothetical protein
MSNPTGPNGRIIKINDNWYLLNNANFARFVSMTTKYRREEGDDNGNIITFKGNDPKEDNVIEIMTYPPPPPPAPPAPPASVSGQENNGRLIMVLVPPNLLNENNVNEVSQFAEFASGVLFGDSNPDANSTNQNHTYEIIELVFAVNKKNKSKGGKKIGLRRRSSSSRRRRSTKRRTASRKQQKRRRGSRRAH